MDVVVKNAGPCRKTVHVEIPVEEIGEERKHVLALYRKKARIPGFRQGKAPQDVVQRRFRKDIEDDLKETLIPRGYHEAIKEKNLDVVAVLGIENVEFSDGRPLTFEVTVDVPPDFKLPRYKAIAIKGEKTEVAETEVNKALTGIREQFAEYKDIDGRPVQKGDLVKIDYEGFCDKRPIEEIAPQATGLGKGEDFWMAADENAFLPGFADGLLGAGVGEKREVQVNFDKDFMESALGGETARYSVDVKAIREKVLPDIDEELLKKMEVDSKEALQSRVRENLQKMADGRDLNRRKSEVVSYLLKKTSFSLPESVVQEEARSTIYDMVRQYSSRGVSQKDLENKKDEIYETATRTAEEKIRLRYILHRISEKENLVVKPEDVESHVQNIAAGYGLAPAAVREEIEKKDAMEKMREDVRMEKTLAFLLEEAKVKF